MGKEATPKEIRPSTTRAGKNLPSRPNFSPDIASAVVPKKKGKIVSSSPLSKMSTSNESDLTCGSIDKEVTLETPEIPEISAITETPENPESSISKNVESELEDREYCDDMETSSGKEGAIIKAFMSPDYDEMDKLASYINSPLVDYFPVTDKMNGSAIKINDKSHSCKASVPSDRHRA